MLKDLGRITYEFICLSKIKLFFKELNLSVRKIIKKKNLN